MAVFQLHPASRLPLSFCLAVWIEMLSLTGAAAGAVSCAGPRTLADWEAAFSSAANDSMRTSLFYQFKDAIETDSLHVATNDDAARVAGVAASCLAAGRPSVLRMVAARFLARHPHAGAADALLACVRDDRCSGRDEALEALVSLRDPRVVAILVDNLRAPSAYPHESTLRHLAESGDRRTLTLLEEHLADRDLAQEFAKAVRNEPHGNENRKANADAIGVESAVREEVATRRAIRDLRLRLDAGITLPFDLPDSIMAGLHRDGFMVVSEASRGESANEMYELYMGEYPFVTTDLAFHSFMILARSSLDELERLVLRPRMGRFCGELARAAAERAKRAGKGSGNGSGAAEARENAAFLGVAAVLLGNCGVGDLGLPLLWRGRVELELSLIRAAHDILPSPVLGEKEDYTKYKPRGRHSSNPEMAGYFYAMTWLGRGTYRLNSDVETRQALSLLDLMDQHPALRTEWEELDRTLGMFFGPRDDLALPDYEEAAKAVLAGSPPGTGRHASDLGRQASLMEAFRAELSRRPTPRIDARGFDTGTDWPATTAGLRIFGQRYTRPAHLFQRELQAGTWPVSCLTIAADLLGSGVAASLLADDPGVSRHGTVREPPAKDAVPASVAKASPSLPCPADPYLDLTEGTLHCATALFQLEPAAPAFMHRPAWELKSVNAALGAWAEVRHATALYDKDANMYMCESPMTDRFHGYVEPMPVFYARLDSLRERLEACLADCGYFDRLKEERSRLSARRDSVARSGPRWSEEVTAMEARLELPDRARFAALSAILRRFETISRAELRGEGQSIADGIFLKGLGRQLKELAFNTSNSDHARLPMALISDPATEYQSGECLEVGVGNPATIYVAVPDGDRTFVCRGAVYTFHEFTQPISQRLDDQEWRKLLAGAPESRPTPWITEVMRRRALQP